MNFTKVEHSFVESTYQVVPELAERDSRICTLKRCPLCVLLFISYKSVRLQLLHFGFSPSNRAFIMNDL